MISKYLEVYLNFKEFRNTTIALKNLEVHINIYFVNQLCVGKNLLCA